MSAKGFDEELFMECFSYFYSTVEKFSQFVGQVPTKVLVEEGGPKGKLVGEFLAADGIDGFDTSSLRETISFTNRYLNSGTYDANEADGIFKRNKEQAHLFINSLSDIKQSGTLGDDYEGTPLIMLVFGYANYMLLGMKSVAGIPDSPTMQNRIDILKSQIADEPPSFEHGQ